MKKWLYRVGIFIVGLLVCLGVYIGISWYTSSYYTIGGVPVLNYHQVNNTYMSPLTMRVSDFENQMKYLHDNGYHTITCAQLEAYLNEDVALPDKPVLITFDDGYVDNYTEVLPILKKYHLTATLFMIADSVGAPRFLTAAQLKEMDQNGFLVEDHTYSHTWMTKLTDGQVRTEIRRSKAVLENVVGHPIRYLAYPGGYANPHIGQLVAEEGIRMAFTVQPNTVSRGDNIMLLPRLPIFEGMDSYYLFRARMHLGHLAHYLFLARQELTKVGFPALASYVPYL